MQVSVLSPSPLTNLASDQTRHLFSENGFWNMIHLMRRGEIQFAMVLALIFGEVSVRLQPGDVRATNNKKYWLAYLSRLRAHLAIP